MPKDSKTKVEKTAQRVKDGIYNQPHWAEEYNKEGIVIYSDDLFGKIKLSIGDSEPVISATTVALDGIVAFSDYFAGGIGGIVPYVPYIRKDS